MKLLRVFKYFHFHRHSILSVPAPPRKFPNTLNEHLPQLTIVNLQPFQSNKVLVHTLVYAIDMNLGKGVSMLTFNSISRTLSRKTSLALVTPKRF